MSRAAQEMSRSVAELVKRRSVKAKATGRRTVEDRDDESGGASGESRIDVGAEMVENDRNSADAAASSAAEDVTDSPVDAGHDADIPSADPDAAKEKQDSTMATKKATRKSAKAAKIRTTGPRKARAAKTAATNGERNALSGVRAHPKNKILFINRAAALDLTHKLLKDALKSGELTTDERFEAERLIARIDARQ